MTKETIDHWTAYLPGKKIRHSSQDENSYVYVYSVKHDGEMFKISGSHEWLPSYPSTFYITNIDEWSLYEEEDA